jgi:hypothetical protein
VRKLKPADFENRVLWVEKARITPNCGKVSL